MESFKTFSRWINLILILHTCSLIAFSQNDKVHFEEAKQVAINTIYQKNTKIKSVDEIYIADSRIIGNEENPDLFIFSIKPTGFVIVSGCKKTNPVFGYSHHNSLDIENYPENFSYFIHETALKINNIKTNVATESHPAWTILSDKNYTRKEVNARNTFSGDTLLQSTWNQTKYYNDFFPLDSRVTEPYGGRVPVGCYNLALGQIMHYYKFPPSGEGRVINDSTSYPRKSWDLTSYPIKWEKIPNSLNSPNEDLARLLHLIGEASDTKHGYGGTSTWANNSIKMLTDNYGYSKSIKLVARSQYRKDEWNSLLKKELDARRPVFYLGTQKNNTRGHGWVCDGYIVNSDSEFEFHMVWGWGGNGDGYFRLDSGIFYFWDENYVDYKNQYMVFQIEPQTSSPLQFKATKGTHDDKVNITWSKSNTLFNGSFFQVLRSQKSDFATAEPVSSWIRDIDNFEDKTGLSNKIYYYWVISAKEISWNQETKSFDGINVSDPSNRDSGYRKGTNNNCSLIEMTSTAGLFDDGSGDANYGSSLHCSWLIKPTNTKFINLKFTSFITEYNYDFVKIYKGDSNTSPLLGSFSGSVIPPSLNVESPSLYIEFITDGSVNKSGWNASYTSSNSPINGDNYDDPCGAKEIPLLPYERYTNGDNSNANTTQNPPPDWFCGQYSDKDLWFRVNIPGRQLYTIKLIPGTLDDAVMMLYTSDDCLSFNTDGICQDDQPNGNLMPEVEVESLIDYPKDRYIRVFGAEGKTGSFGICVIDRGKYFADKDLEHRTSEHDAVSTSYSSKKRSPAMIFPNPAYDIFNVNLENNISAANVKIYSTTGKLVYRDENFSPETKIHCIYWPSGVYFAEIIVNGVILKDKIIVTHE
jgi:hypothetical protein